VALAAALAAAKARECTGFDPAPGFRIHPDFGAA
jgi:hypothetical protein